LELTQDDFYEHIGKDNYVIVEFYTQWCHFCRMLAPEYEKLYEFIKENRKDITVARIEAEMQQDVSYEYKIYSFPKIVLFNPLSVDVAGIFNGSRTFGSLLSWVNVNTKEAKKEFKIIEEKPQVINPPDDIKELDSQSLQEIKNDLQFLHTKIESAYKNWNELTQQSNPNLNNHNFYFNTLYSMITSFDFILMILIIVILFAGFVTFKRIYNKL
jgi:thiol-disulfide isomerase/thioredoxin